MTQIEEYVRRILKVQIYIEDHIDKDLTIEILAKVACYSPYHFHRIFQAIVGESVHRYVKRLKLQKAAEKLCYTEQPITEIALDSYETPSAFTKAFKQFMGTSPRCYRTLVNTITEKIKELPMIQPDSIEKHLPNLKLYFIRTYGDYTQSTKEAWGKMIPLIEKNQLDCSKIRYFGVSHDDPKTVNKENLRYEAAICSEETLKEQGGLGLRELKGGKYAIFTHKGCYSKLAESFNKVFLKWLPTSKENFDEKRAIFCEYLNRQYAKTNPEKLVTKLYIPLQE